MLRYHGPISRPHAELLLKNEGDFLIRDSSSGQPGNLVLSTFWKDAHLHFIIAKVNSLNILFKFDDFTLLLK